MSAKTKWLLWGAAGLAAVSVVCAAVWDGTNWAREIFGALVAGSIIGVMVLLAEEYAEEQRQSKAEAREDKREAAAAKRAADELRAGDILRLWQQADEVLIEQMTYHFSLLDSRGKGRSMLSRGQVVDNDDVIRGQYHTAFTRLGVGAYSLRVIASRMTETPGGQGLLIAANKLENESLQFPADGTEDALAQYFVEHVKEPYGAVHDLIRAGRSQARAALDRTSSPDESDNHEGGS